MMRRIDWQLLRALGELQILTRASYFMLIFVPILAGLWPSARAVIYGYNEAIVNGTQFLKGAISKLENEVEVIEVYARMHDNSVEQAFIEAKETIQSLTPKVDEIFAFRFLKPLDKMTMPRIWAEGFIASLIVFFAHTLYQVRAPILIRRITLDDHQANARRAQAETPSALSIQLALRKIGQVAQLLGYECNIEKVPPTNEQAREIWNLDIVYEGAGAEYVIEASKNKWSALSCCVLYCVGIVLIIHIVFDQAIAVFDAAGWLGEIIVRGEEIK